MILPAVYFCYLTYFWIYSAIYLNTNLWFIYINILAYLANKVLRRRQEGALKICIPKIIVGIIVYARQWSHLTLRPSDILGELWKLNHQETWATFKEVKKKTPICLGVWFIKHQQNSFFPVIKTWLNILLFLILIKR